MPLVTIIIPCYNAELYVATAIQSALRQTYQNREVIVIDDGSTDNSLNVIRSFGNKIRSESGPNRGASSARNRGLALARGKYIQFLDADDFISPNKIELHVAALEGTDENNIATCAHCYCDTQNNPELLSRMQAWRSYADGIDLLVDTWNGQGSFPVHAWLSPKKLLLKAGPWNEDLTGDDDGEFFGRVLLVARKVIFEKRSIAYYRRPAQTNLSSARRPNDIRSYFKAWDVLHASILSRRSDREARLAVLRRLRIITYFYAHDNPTWIDWAAIRERKFWSFDWDIPIPKISALLICFFGLSGGLRLRWVGLKFNKAIKS
jgi:glycosyltransferase involved in cell wall biosynthesis